MRHHFGFLNALIMLSGCPIHREYVPKKKRPCPPSPKPIPKCIVCGKDGAWQDDRVCSPECKAIQKANKQPHPLAGRKKLSRRERKKNNALRSE